jgi:hypothetical protein
MEPESHFKVGEHIGRVIFAYIVEKCPTSLLGLPRSDTILDSLE